MSLSNDRRKSLFACRLLGVTERLVCMPGRVCPPGFLGHVWAGPYESDARPAGRTEFCAKTAVWSGSQVVSGVSM